MLYSIIYEISQRVYMQIDVNFDKYSNMAHAYLMPDKVSREVFTQLDIPAKSFNTSNKVFGKIIAKS